MSEGTVSSFDFTDHFTFAELTRTSQPFPNLPTLEACYRMRALCSALLEPWRTKVGPLDTTSGFRSREVNTAVGGDPNSQHLLGEAWDGRPVKTSLDTAWYELVKMVNAGLPVDQAVYYVRKPGEGWIHVSHTHRRSARADLRVNVGTGKPTVPWATYFSSGKPMYVKP